MATKYDTFWTNEETGEIHTPKARMAWPTLLEPKRIKDKPDSKPKFSVSLLVPKTADVNPLAKAIAEALKTKFGAAWLKPDAGKIASASDMLDKINKKLICALKKTVDHEKLAEYAAEFPFVLSCSANEDFPPFIYGPDAKKFAGGASEIYAGRWATSAGKLWAYDNVSKGVLFGLNRIQLLDHDEPIAGGRVATSSGFESVGGTEFDVGSGKATAAKAASADDVFGDGDATELGI